MKHLFDRLVNILLMVGAPTIIAAFALFVTYEDWKNKQPFFRAHRSIPIVIVCVLLGLITLPFAALGYGLLYLDEEVF